MTIDLRFAPDVPVTVFCHRNPDPDTIGCGLAFAHYLRAEGVREVQVINPDFEQSHGASFTVLPGYAEMVVPASKAWGARAVAVSVDAASLDQLGAGKDAFLASHEVSVVIDHHASNMGFGKTNILDTTAVTCAIPVRKVIDRPLSENEAICLWAGLVTDTGNFKYATAREFALAAEIADAGIDTQLWTRLLTSDKPVEWLDLMRKVVPNIEYDTTMFDGHGVTSVIVTREDKAGLPTDLTHTVVDFAQQVGPTVVTVVASEIEDRTWRVSLRSTDAGKVNVGALAVAFDGGGHRQAAGFTYTGDARQLVSLLGAAWAHSQS